MKFTSRPELDEVPDSQNFAAFKNIDRNKDGILRGIRVGSFSNPRRRYDAGSWPARAQDQRRNSHYPVARKHLHPRSSSPLLYKDRLYLVRNGGVVTCLEAPTGKVIYRTRSGSPGPYFASPVAAAGQVYLASGEGVVTCSCIEGSTGRLAKNDLGEESSQHPPSPAA